MESSRKLPQKSKKTGPPCDLAILLLGIDPKEMKSMSQELSTLPCSSQPKYARGCTIKMHLKTNECKKNDIETESVAHY